MVLGIIGLICFVAILSSNLALFATAAGGLIVTILEIAIASLPFMIVWWIVKKIFKR